MKWVISFYNKESIDFSRNAINGSLPSELGLLTSVTYMSVGTNQLTGPIPLELGQLTNITGLSLLDNKLSGTLPTEIGHLTSLNDFRIYSNKFTGAIPTEIGLMSSLSKFCLSETYISWPFVLKFHFLDSHIIFWKEQFYRASSNRSMLYCKYTELLFAHHWFANVVATVSHIVFNHFLLWWFV